MNPLYEKAKDVILIRRTSDNKEFEEYPLTVYPVSALVTDPANDIQCVSICSLRVGYAVSSSYTETASYAHSSSAALYAISASFANSSSYTLSASYASTASFGLEASSALSSEYADSASYAFSASYAQSSSYGTNFYAPRVTSSYMSASGFITADTFVGRIARVTQLTASTVSASTAVNTATVTTVNETLYGTMTLQSAGLIRASSGTMLRIDTGSVRAPTISSSAALLGRVNIYNYSQSLVGGDAFAITRSLGTIPQDGVYRLVVASTIGQYSGSTLVTNATFGFKHTDRLGTYVMGINDGGQLTSILPAPYPYNDAYLLSGDWIFQAVGGSAIEYYLSSPQLSSTPCSASFFTMTTLSQIMSGSVTSSLS